MCHNLLFIVVYRLISTSFSSFNSTFVFPVDKGADVVKLPDEILIERGSQAVDFRGEALTFKATTAGVLARLQHCLDLFNQSQDGWRRRLEREVEKRKKVEDLYRQALEELRVANENKPHQQLLVQGNGHGLPVHYQQQLSTESKRIVLVGGPDYQEGPHSTIGEDEFYDAVEAGLDKIDEEQQYLERLKNKQVVRFASQAPAHPLWPEVCYLYCIIQQDCAKL